MVVDKAKFIGVVKNVNGKYVFENKEGFVFNIPQDEIAKRLAYSNEIAIAESTDGGRTQDECANVEIIEIMGKEGDPIPEGLAIAKLHGLVREVGEDVREQVASIPDKIDAKKFLSKFNDLRYVPFVTIDPDRAKDFDDAVYAEKLDDGTYIIRKAIANVAYYVGGKESPLFEHIKNIGTSSYLGNIVYPMLPEELSNGICSLNEGVDRLVLCTTVHMGKLGEIIDFTIEPAIINSNHRLTYKEVDFIHDGTVKEGMSADDFKGVIAKTIDVKKSIDALFAVSDILERQRHDRGALDIEGRDPEFVLDDTGKKVICVEQEHAENSTKVIESLAILTNELQMEAFKRLGVSAIYRNHDLPEEENEEKLRHSLERFGITLPNELTGKALQDVVELIKHKRFKEPVTALLLKSLKRAYYSEENKGHVGLGINNEFADLFKEDILTPEEALDKARMGFFKLQASRNGLYFEGDVDHEGYGHTTSPIRRGPDTVNQMQMMNMIHNGTPLFDKDELFKLSNKFNELEKNSDEAAREYDDLLASIWAKDHIGETFDGVIVKFDENNVVIMNDDNIKFYIPYSEIKSVYLNDYLIKYMRAKNGGPKLHHKKGEQQKKNKNQARPALCLGDELKDVMIYDVTTKPARIYGTEDRRKLEQYENKNPEL